MSFLPLWHPKRYAQSRICIFLGLIPPQFALQWFQSEAPLSPKNVMSMSRPNVTRSSMRSNLTLDEQSFQSLLSAAFTIQEHNDFLKAHPPASSETDSKLEASV